MKTARPLLPLDSPKYLRRLVRELNSLPDGFYYGDTRAKRAGLRDGSLQVIPCGNSGFRAIPSLTEFRDAYGRSVVASRRD